VTSPVRLPAVAGRFYPRHREELLREINGYTSPAPTSLIRAIGCVVPHAGYIYSGRVAGQVFSHLEIPEHCIILCPNHTGYGVALATMTTSSWQTPLGEVRASEHLGKDLLQRFPLLKENSAAHQSEHAIEVELPFLQVRQNNLHILPIAIGTRDFEILHALGQAIAEVVDRSECTVLIVVSSDMNHYESDTVTRVKDRKAIEHVLNMDARGLWDTVMSEGISMCGFGPTIVMLTAAKILGATSATLVRYATSGEVSGDFEHVVGYAGIIVE
jgi:MEMO1 family protein